MITILFMCCLAVGQTYTITGRVVSSVENLPLTNANIYEGNGSKTTTDAYGYFTLPINAAEANLKITHIGYEQTVIKMKLPHIDTIIVTLKPNANLLEEVVVSTGYEEIPLERATGSFEKIDYTLFNRGVGMDVLSRLENITSGIHFDKQNFNLNESGQRPNHDIYIHGISTLRTGATGGSSPLIVLDNFPYDGDVNDINPNDIESVTILKDAAASSIWGAKAGNGVIVITSKKAAYDLPLSIRFNHNTTITSKPGLFQFDVIESEDLIEVERFLFENGFYNNMEANRSKPALPPAVEVLIALRDGLISMSDAERLISGYAEQDVRHDMLRFLYRKPIHQQYALSASGGTQHHGFLFSGGYDKSRATRMGDNHNRLSLRFENSVKPIKSLEMQTAVRWAYNKGHYPDFEGFYQGNGYRYPYIRLADEDGQALPIPHDYRTVFLDTAGAGQLLDWHFRPIDEVRNPPNHTMSQELMLNTTVRYNIQEWFQVSLNYQYARNEAINNTHYDLENYYARNQVNRGTEIVGDQLRYHFPYGGVLANRQGVGIAHQGRAQANVNKTWSEKHALHSLIGMELQQLTNTTNGYTLYGYDHNLLTYANNVDHTSRYPVYGNLASSGMVPYPLNAPSETSVRYVSLFGNASYTYGNRYTASVSARRDASNLFGVSTNNKWTPLWSVGLAWTVSNEQYFNLPWVSGLKFRGTYGYSGNVDNSMSALTTLTYTTNPASTGVSWPSATVRNLPNPTLRWEKVRTLNVGIDATLFEGYLSLNVDSYWKYTEDLLDNMPMDVTTGITLMVMNVANTKSKGVDIRLGSQANFGSLMWSPSLVFTYNNNWVTQTYLEDYYSPSRFVRIGSISDMKGTLAFPAYSYKWAGLDPETGEPRGYLHGEASKDYFALTSANVGLDELVFHGSARPLYFGSLLNTVNYGPLSLSFNITYQFAYFFRRPALSYTDLFNNGIGLNDFYNRWQKPGDELTTHVPAMTYPANSLSNSFYPFTEPLVERGDHVRLKDIKISYALGHIPSLKFKSFEAFGYVSNLGFLWRANKHGYDPSTRSTMQVPRTYSLGVTFNL